MRRFLRRTLESHGYRLVEAETARQGLAHATAHNPDVVLLDLGLPDLDGLELTRQLREWSQTPIVVISARGEEASKIAALDAGADDYLTKPFAAGELLARIRVALRHAARSASGREEPVVTFGAVRVDLARRLVFRSDVEVHLTPNEYKLLAAFARNPGRVLTHPQLLREVWGKSAAAEPHVLRVYVNQLRQKLEDEPARPRYLRTEPGVGYRLRTEG
ncbi:MAG: response regulator [Acidobacteria bacterium]|nr:response regulator [Acidobacteriota bacterium]